MTSRLMLVTEEWMEEKFREFNVKYFNNELPTPRFLVVENPNFYGQCGAKNWRADHPDFVIKMSSYFIRKEYDYMNTLLHEMIHLHFQSHGNWKEKHGDNFKAIAIQLNRKGWSVKV